MWFGLVPSDSEPGLLLCGRGTTGPGTDAVDTTLGVDDFGLEVIDADLEETESPRVRSDGTWPLPASGLGLVNTPEA